MMEFIKLNNDDFKSFISTVIESSKNGHDSLIEMYGYKTLVPANLSSSSVRIIIKNNLNTIKNMNLYKDLLINNTELSIDEIEQIASKGAFELADTCFEYGLTGVNKLKTL